MFDPNRLDAHYEERHAGKAMIVFNDESLSVTIDCTVCERIEIGPFPIMHIASIIQMLTGVATSLGIDIETSATLVGEEVGSNVEEGIRRYEQMPNDPRTDPHLSKLLDERHAGTDEDPWA